MGVLNTIFRYFSYNDYLKSNTLFIKLIHDEKDLPAIINTQVEKKNAYTYLIYLNQLKVIDSDTVIPNYQLIGFLLEIINTLFSENIDDIHRNYNFIFVYHSLSLNKTHYYIYDYVKGNVKLLDN